MAINKTIDQVFDLEYLKSIIDDDQEFKKELFEIFFDNLSKNIIKLKEAIELNDKNLWYMTSHALKGASASIGAFELAKIFDIAQKNFENSQDDKIKIINKIDEELYNVKEFYQKI